MTEGLNSIQGLNDSYGAVDMGYSHIVAFPCASSSRFVVRQFNAQAYYLDGSSPCV